MNATNNNDITAIPEFTNPIFFALFPRAFFRGLEKNLDDLLKKDLLPFIKLYKNIPIPIMTSHLKFPKIDNEIVTYSKVWLNKISQEIFSNENRVAITPGVAAKLLKFGYEVQIEKGLENLTGSLPKVKKAV